MPVFQYRALTEDGREERGIADADSPREARKKLKAKRLHVTEISPLSTSTGGVRSGGRRLFFRKKRIEELAIVTRQIATLLESGIPLVGALTAVIDQTEDRRLKTALFNVRERVSQGSTFTDALGANPDFFNELYVNMVTAGEASGTLDKIMHRIADYLQRQNRIQGKIVAALTYPIMMMIIGSVVVVFLLACVVPKITEFLVKQKQALPLPTMILMSVSSFVQHYWWLLIIAVVAVVALYISFKRTEKGQLTIDTMKLKIPLVGNLLRKQAVSRFALIFSTLLGSGLPVLEALRVVKNIVNNKLLANTIEVVRQKVAEGADIATPMKNSKIFPPVVAYMIAVGEESGRLEELLRRVSEAYDEEIDLASQRLTSMLEPLMIVFMAAIVGFIVLAILLPIFKMSSM